MFLHLLKRAVPIPKLTDFDNFLFVGPHPDDIEVACGATVAVLTKMGKRVTFLVATDGCVGSVDGSLTEQQIVQIRQQEALASAKLLGVADVIFLPYNDGCGYNAQEMKRDVVATILQVKPQVVFCPDYTVPNECHPDHVDVGNIVTRAVFDASWQKITARLGLCGAHNNVTLAYYYTHKPNSYVGVSKTYKLHLQAVAMHTSQFTKQQMDAYKSYFGLRQRRFGLRCGKLRADGYRVLSPAHQHCLPEFGE